MLWILGLVLVFVALAQSEALARWQVLALALVSYGSSATAWLLGDSRPLIGRWVTVTALAAVVLFGSGLLGQYELLSFLVVPNSLAVAMIGIPGATGIVVGETVLVLLLPGLVPVEASPATTFAVMITVWGMLFVMAALYVRLYRLGNWLGEYHQRAQDVLEEARSRRAELEQAFEDLAKANRQIALSNERLASLRLIAEDARRTKAAFVAKVSHEFRTPLNMIIGLVSLMVENPSVYAEDLPPELQKDLNTVYRNCEHLASMVNDVLDLSQAEAGHFTLYKEQVDLREIIDSAVLVVRPLVEKKGLELRIALPDDLPQVYCDRTRIRQVVLNLVGNAARFTDEGGIEIRIERRVERVRLCVTDTGPGIAPQDVEKIFEPFCQGSGRLWRDRPGTGLGLTISKQFVERHGGRIWVESELGIGTTCFVELPISTPMERLATPGRWIRGQWIWRGPGFRTDRARLADHALRPRVVICDDTDTLYPAFVRSCDEVEFVATRELEQAVREARQFPVHAVVLNTEEAERLRPLLRKAAQELPGTPVIGCSVPPRLQRAVEAGAAGYLIKPVMRSDLEGAVRRLGKPVKRVLVVDDDPDVLQLFKRMLHLLDESLHIALAATGEQALEEMRQHAPDLVLLDVVMPDMDGWEVLERKGKEAALSNIPVIFISGQDPTEQPLVSEAVTVTVEGGLTFSQLLVCSLGLPALLMKPARTLGPMLAQTAGVEPA